MQKNKMPVPTEAQEQMTLFSWAANTSGGGGFPAASSLQRRVQQ